MVDRLRSTGITTPFPIQAATIADALSGRDVLGRAETGAGKTLAFGLPVLARLAARRTQSRRPLALILVPTRELAVQVADALAPIGHTVGVRMHVVAGGLPIGRQIKALTDGVHVVVATPGRLTDLVERGACRLDAVEVVVLDEADRMSDMGFLPVVRRFLDACPKTGQRLLFSATLDGAVDVLVRRYLRNPVTRSVTPPAVKVPPMEHHVLHVSAADKVDVAAHVASREGRSLLFVRTKHGADRLVKTLRSRGVHAGALHGGMTQGARTKALERFRDGSVPALVATDVAARGIHVDEVGLVLHVDPPADPKDYLHRSGRTARAGERGVVAMLVLPDQRREVAAMTAAAGVRPRQATVSRSTDVLAGITGARPPSGVPVVAQQQRPPTSSARPRRSRGRRRAA
jgi:superfamily II DNA/RNA helicase